MARQIWKFPIIINDEYTVVMPACAHILTVQLQNGEPYIWAMVETDMPKVERRFRVFDTGQDIPSPIGQYVGTVQRNGFVWHVFEA